MLFELLFETAILRTVFIDPVSTKLAAMIHYQFSHGMKSSVSIDDLIQNQFAVLSVDARELATSKDLSESRVFELHQYIDIAFFRLLSSNKGAEEAMRRTAKRSLISCSWPLRISMTFKKAPHLVTPLIPNDFNRFIYFPKRLDSTIDHR
jgi:hypothetical protein